jgi:hypothetical protein
MSTNSPVVLGIDPGNEWSAFALIDAATCRVIVAGKTRNEDHMVQLVDWCVGDPEDPAPRFDALAIEWVESYGMAVGREVFDTCRWVGRFQQLADVYATETPCTLVTRRLVKLHHCGTSKAKDPNIIAALVERFAPGEPNRGKGTKDAPGWFHGFAADVWQAYAVAVLQADVTEGRQDKVGVA